MLSIAIGEIGISEDDFWQMTPRVFYAAQKGYLRKMEHQEQYQWERARWMATVIINPHLKKSIQPQKLIRFPWEKAEPLTPQEIEEVANTLGRYLN